MEIKREFPVAACHLRADALPVGRFRRISSRFSYRGVDPSRDRSDRMGRPMPRTQRAGALMSCSGARPVELRVFLKAAVS